MMTILMNMVESNFCLWVDFYQVDHNKNEHAALDYDNDDHVDYDDDNVGDNDDDINDNKDNVDYSNDGNVDEHARAGWPDYPWWLCWW